MGLRNPPAVSEKAPMSDTPKPKDDGVTRHEVPSAEGQAASTGSEASVAYGEGSIQILDFYHASEHAGDLAKAEELLRIRSGAKASKAAGRIAAALSRLGEMV